MTVNEEHNNSNSCGCNDCFENKIKRCPVKLEVDSNVMVDNADDGEDGCFLDIDLKEQDKKIRSFASGSTRDSSDGKIDFEGFLSPIVLEKFGKYMMKHQKQSNGEFRPSDNWQKGMPKDVYMKSAWRHFHDWWMEHRDYKSREGLTDALMGLLFNVMGYTFEVLKDEQNKEKIDV